MCPLRNSDNSRSPAARNNAPSTSIFAERPLRTRKRKFRSPNQNGSLDSGSNTRCRRRRCHPRDREPIAQADASGRVDTVQQPPLLSQSRHSSRPAQSEPPVPFELPVPVVEILPCCSSSLKN